MDRRKAAIGYATFVIAKKVLKRSLRKKAASITSTVEAAAGVIPGMGGGEAPRARRWGLLGGLGGALLVGAGALAWFLKGRGGDEDA